MLKTEQDKDNAIWGCTLAMIKENSASKLVVLEIGCRKGFNVTKMKTKHGKFSVCTLTYVFSNVREKT